MAFGKDETDTLYDRTIVPTLNEVNLHAVRVDRMEHNDDIDDRIIQELKECRLAIADLTFTRPSVYFEAGYAERVVPVIYTCRKDHFDRGSPDTARVHFDLQMRNIIDWSHPDEPKFRLRLAKRLNHVLRPILKEERRIAEHGDQEAQFRGLSVNEQRRAMKQILQEEFSKARFRPYDIQPNESGFYSGIENILRTKVRYGFKRRGASLTIVEGLVPDGGALKSISEAAQYETELQTNWFDANKSKGRLHFARHIFVCTSEKVSRERLLRSMTNFVFDTERDCFAGTTLGLLSWRHAGHLYNLPLFVYVLDGVKSLDELRMRVRKQLSVVGTEKLKER